MRDTFELRKARKSSAYFTINGKGDICIKVEETNLQSKLPADRSNGKSPQTGNKWLGKIKSVCPPPPPATRRLVSGSTGGLTDMQMNRSVHTAAFVRTWVLGIGAVQDQKPVLLFLKILMPNYGLKGLF